MSVPANRRRVRQWWHEMAQQVPEEFQVLEAVTSMKCIDHNGSVCLLNIKSDALNTWEAIGMLVSAQDDLRAVLQSVCEEDDD
jgi:hypothetical protein